MADSTSLYPMTVMDCSEALMGIGSGQFTRGFDEKGRRFLASLYGAPFFAISQLAPQVLGLSDSKLLLIAPSNSMLASDGGRWLSLYAKVIRSDGRLSLSVCVPTKPRSMKPPKPLLFQPIQSIVVKDWQKQLESINVLPDVLLYYPDTFDELQLAASQFARYAIGCKILVFSPTEITCQIVRRFFQLHGYDVGNNINFQLAENQPQHCSYGAWCFEAHLLPNREIAYINAEESEKLKLASERYEMLMSKVRPEDRAALAETYCKRIQCTVGKEVIQAIRISGNEFLDLASGSTLVESSVDSDLRINWSDVKLSSEAIKNAPRPDSFTNEGDDRLALSIWLSQSFSQLVVRAQDKLERDGSSLLEETSEYGVETGASLLEKPSTPENEKSVNDESNCAKTPSREDLQKCGSPKIVTRQRLSRGAGTINVLALAAQLGRVGHETTDSFTYARGKLLSWLGNKGFKMLDATTNEHREEAVGEVTIETDGECTWSVRFDDRRSMESGAIWRVEATVLARPVQAISLRLFQVRRSEEAPPPVASGVPNVVATIAKEVGLQDAGVPLQESALRFTGEADYQRLRRLLLNPSRAQPVIVISGPTDASADRLAKRLVGVAHVAIIDTVVSNQLVRGFGRDLSVYGSAVRLYRPGFNADADQYQHRVWPRKGLQLSKWIADDIFEEACTISIDGQDLEDRAPSFATVRSHLASARLSSTENRLSDLRKQAESIASSKDEQIMQLQSIRTELESALEEYKFKANELLGEKAGLQEELEAVRIERNSALEEMRQLRYKYNNQWEEQAAPVSIDNEPGYYPDSWDDLETWVDIYGDNKLVLHEKAAKAARASSFRDIPLAYKAMDYLVRYYIPMRTRSEDDVDARSRSLQALAELGLEESDVGTADDIRRYKKEYERMYNGKTVTLDRHLKRGVGFGGEYQFRLYFYYDRERAKVLIGHLPSHLTNRLSHNG